MSFLAWLNPRRWFSSPARDRGLTWAQIASAGHGQAGAPAGVPVTLDTALGVSAVYCADRVIAEDLASLPMLVYQGHRLDDGAKPLFTDRVTDLLARPNPEQTGPVFWSAFQHNANLWGFGLAEIVRDGAGEPIELWPLQSPDCRLDRDRAGRLTFSIPVKGGGLGPLANENALFLPGFSPDGSIGFKLLHVARMTIGTAAAGQEFAAAAFRNGINPSGAITAAGVLTPQALANMRASWSALYAGPGKARVPMILEEGTGWEEMAGSHAEQMQLAQLAEFYVDEVARYFNISPVKLHKLGRATWANLETLNRDHVITTLGPWIAKRDAEVDAKLLGPGRHCRHIVDRLLTADTATRFEAWAKALGGSPWMTPNDVRRREDLAPLPGGDELARPLNQAPAGDAAPPSTEETPNGNEIAPGNADGGPATP